MHRSAQIAIEGVTVHPLKVMEQQAGDVLHMLRDDTEPFKSFGEVYFSYVNAGFIKGWKKHLRMTMNIVVPLGSVTFFFRVDEIDRVFSTNIGVNNYCRITVKPGVWVAFRGEDPGGNMLLNIASIEHDPDEQINEPLDSFQLERS